MKYYKLHLIRHGLTEGNLKGLYIGSGSDLPLCAEGRAQLKTLKKDFGYPQVPLVFTSPMLRATQTAESYSPVCGRSNCTICGRWPLASLRASPCSSW